MAAVRQQLVPQILGEELHLRVCPRGDQRTADAPHEGE
jgi:hypothetical protein